jgi:preprotein translocase subunit SecE
MATPNFLGRPASFLKEVKNEMSKVTWLSRQQTIRLTLIVIGVSLVVAFFIGALDFIFTKIMGLII